MWPGDRHQFIDRHKGEYGIQPIRNALSQASAAIAPGSLPFGRRYRLDLWTCDRAEYIRNQVVRPVDGWTNVDDVEITVADYVN